MDGIGSMIGTSELKKQHQEIKGLKLENSNLNSKIKQLEYKTQTMESEHTRIIDKLRQELKKIYDLFPNIRELLRIENRCKRIGFSEGLTKMILTMKPVGFSGKLRSSENGKEFNTEHSEAKIEEDPIQKGKLQLLIDNLTHTDWFRQKQKNFLKSIGIEQKNDRKTGMRM